MNPRPRLRPHVGAIAILLVLCLASAGSAVAGSLITSAQIKDGTIKVKDLNKKTVKKLQGKSGPVGAQGEQGEQGEQGPAGTARGSALIFPAGAVYNPVGAFENLTVVHPATGVYCLGSKPGTSNGIGNYGSVVVSAHGTDFTKHVATVNLEFGSTCNPHGGHGVFVTNLAGTAVDGYFAIALM
ncbi:hypothetical protein [Nocardioides sp.]|uniref:hypothetical protein n=1 Tax=Nocardioides sp. TaxID=35761 RepID=UPI002B265588|nr:hypothetical protein [Nocardioides sp.]